MLNRRRPNFDDGSVVFYCGSCGEYKHRQSFSRNQLECRQDKKCISCVQQEQTRHSRENEHPGRDERNNNNNRDVNHAHADLLMQLLQLARASGNDDNAGTHDNNNHHRNSDQTRHEEQRARNRNCELRSAARNPKRSTKTTDFFQDHINTTATVPSGNSNNKAASSRNDQKNNTKTKTFDSQEFVKEEILTCPICYEEMSLEPDCHFRCMFLKCGHSLCFSCFAKMKKKTQHGEFHFFDSDDDNNEAYDSNNEELKCPVCREAFNHACEMPRSLKILIQFAQKHIHTVTVAATTTTTSLPAGTTSNAANVDYPGPMFPNFRDSTAHRHRHHVANGNDDDDDDWEDVDDDDDDEDEHDTYDTSESSSSEYHGHLANYTTGRVNNINHSKRCGGVTLDDSLIRHSVVFFFATSPRFNDLKVGSFVKFRVEDNPKRPGDFIAFNVEPFDE